MRYYWVYTSIVLENAVYFPPWNLGIGVVIAIIPKSDGMKPVSIEWLNNRYNIKSNDKWGL